MDGFALAGGVVSADGVLPANAALLADGEDKGVLAGAAFRVAAAGEVRGSAEDGAADAVGEGALTAATCRSGWDAGTRLGAAVRTRAAAAPSRPAMIAAAVSGRQCRRHDRRFSRGRGRSCAGR
jgi:hypothetical protein